MPADRPVRARVAVIRGGQNCEHEVSLASAAADLPYPELLDLLVADTLAGRCRNRR